MKTHLFLSLIGEGILLSAFIACNNDVYEDSTSHFVQNIRMVATDFVEDNYTRTEFQITDKGAEFSWSSNDTVGIFPESGAQAYFPMVQGAGTKNAVFTGGGWSLRSDAVYAAYYPFKGNFYTDRHDIRMSYSGQKQCGNSSITHLGAFDYMAAESSIPDKGNVNFLFNHLGCLIRLNVTFPKPMKLSLASFLSETECFTKIGSVDLLSNESVRITPVEKTTSQLLQLEDVSTTEDDLTATLYLMLAPVNLLNQSLKLCVIDSEGNSYETTFVGKNFVAGKAYSLSFNMNDATVVENVFHVATAGILPFLIGDEQKYIVNSLKLTGDLNGTDIRFIREMMGRDANGEETDGKLQHLDISEASIVEGGDYYFCLPVDDTTASTTSACYYFTTNRAIGDYMFYKCDRLKAIILPNREDNAVTTIGVSSFQDCKILETVNIPDGVKKISTNAFSAVAGLNSIVIPGSVFELDMFSFLCSRLTKVILNEGVRRIGMYSFAFCSTKQVFLPSTLESLGMASFQLCPIDEIHCAATTPPAVDILCFDGVDVSSCKLYVPSGSVRSYETANGWSVFQNILAEESEE